VTDFAKGDRVRRAKILLSPDRVRAMLHLPDDVEILWIYGNPDPPSIAVIVQGDRFDAIPLDCEAPVIPVAWSGEMVFVDGKPYTRTVWSTDERDGAGLSERLPPPEPLYVNAPEITEPETGDVVRDADDEDDLTLWQYRAGRDREWPWLRLGVQQAATLSRRVDLPKHLTLLVRGGKVWPS